MGTCGRSFEVKDMVMILCIAKFQGRVYGVIKFVSLWVYVLRSVPSHKSHETAMEAW